MQIDRRKSSDLEANTVDADEVGVELERRFRHLKIFFGADDTPIILADAFDEVVEGGAVVPLGGALRRFGEADVDASEVPSEVAEERLRKRHLDGRRVGRIHRSECRIGESAIIVEGQAEGAIGGGEDLGEPEIPSRNSFV